MNLYEAFDFKSDSGGGKHSSSSDAFLSVWHEVWEIPQRFDNFDGDFKANPTAVFFLIINFIYVGNKVF